MELLWQRGDFAHSAEKSVIAVRIISGVTVAVSRLGVRLQQKKLQVHSKNPQEAQESPIDHNDGQILSTVEWSMVFVKIPLCLMVFQWFLYNWTIAIE